MDLTTWKCICRRELIFAQLAEKFLALFLAQSIFSPESPIVVLSDLFQYQFLLYA
jgi:hypothetical protein